MVEKEDAINKSCTEHNSRWLNKTVLGAGLTSSLGDFCYETTTVILPGFLTILGVPPAALGIIEGIADAVAASTQMISGYAADRLGHRKLLVLTGYALTPIGQIVIAVAGGWPLILVGRVVSWFGKGLRGPLRDAIVIQSVSEKTRGRAFGFHRATDSIGAVLGPLLGVYLLGWAQTIQWSDASGAFRFVLWLSLIPGFCAVLTFLIMVKDPEQSSNPAKQFWSSVKALPARFRYYLAATGIFGIGNFSHSLLILAATLLLTRSHGALHAAQIAGFLYVLRNVVQVAASYPAGWLADRVGHFPVLIAGYVLGGFTAVLMAGASYFKVDDIASLTAMFCVAGMYTAIQEALESTVTAEMVMSDTLSLSYGALGTVNGLARFVSSASVGLIWTVYSPVVAFSLAAAFMFTGTIMMSAAKK